MSAHWPTSSAEPECHSPFVGSHRDRLGKGVVCGLSPNMSVPSIAFLVGHLRRQQKVPALGRYITTLTSQVSISAPWPHFAFSTGPGLRQAGSDGTEPAALSAYQNSPR